MSFAIAPGSTKLPPTSIVIGLSPISVISGAIQSSNAVIIPISNDSLAIFWLFISDKITFVILKL